MKKSNSKSIALYSIAGFLVGIFFANITELGVCNTGFCRNILEDTVGVPVGLFSVALFVLSIILLFLQEKVFRAWVKFAKWYLPIVAVIIIIFPAQAGFLSPDRETITWLTAGVFLIASLSIIIFKSW